MSRRAVELSHQAEALERGYHLDEAHELFVQACAAWRDSVGPTDARYAKSLDALARVCQRQGAYDRALRLFGQATDVMRETSGGRDHPDYATSLDHLAGVLWEMGDLDSSERMATEACDLRLASLGRDHPLHALSLNHLGLILQAKARAGSSEVASVSYELAGTRFKEALRSLPAADADLRAVILNNLGMFGVEREEYAAAESHFRESLEIRTRLYGPSHPDVATCLNNIGRIRQHRGDLEDARTLFDRALEIRLQILGRLHPHSALSFTNLAGLEVVQGRPEAAMQMLQQAEEAEGALLSQVLGVGSERQRLMFIENRRSFLFQALTLVARYLREDRTAVAWAFDLTVRRKAILSEALAAQRDRGLQERYPGLVGQLRTLNRLRTELAGLFWGGATLDDPKERIQQLKERRDAVEAELAAAIPELDRARHLFDVDHKVIAARLESHGAALVEFVRFNPYDFLGAPSEGRWGEAEYLAFVMRSDGEVEMVPLAPAGEIDSLTEQYRAGLPQPERDRGLAHEPTLGPADAALQLRSAVFDPLAPALRGHRRLFLAPDGALARVSFDALPRTEGGFVFDMHDISYVTVGRDLAGLGGGRGDKGTSYVGADPNFLLAGASSSNPGRTSRDATADRLHFTPLPATRPEGVSVAALLGVEPSLGDAVLKRSVRESKSPVVLHLATHGFALTDQAPNPNRRHAFNPPAFSNPLVRCVPAGFENPLLRSGLALAGAQTWLDGGTPPEAAEDGLLTAEEVTGMDLHGTEMVVLSACGTGLGEVRSGEGVFGLRRAFVLAGAKTLIMSLWSVPDLPTAILMEQFYIHLLGGDRPRGEALRAAQQHVRDLPVRSLRRKWLTDRGIERLTESDVRYREQLHRLAKRPDDFRPYAHPVYWGAFICQGDTGVLSRELVQQAATESAVL